MKNLFTALTLLTALTLPGCTASIRPQLEEQLIEKKADAKVTEANLARAEKEFAAEAVKPSPDPVKLLELDGRIAVFELEALKSAAHIQALQEKIKQVEASEKALLDAAEQGAAYLPSPFNELAMIGITLGVAYWKHRGVVQDKTAEARTDTQARADAILADVVSSVGEVLSPELKARIKQGPVTKTAVDKAQGRV